MSIGVIGHHLTLFRMLFRSFSPLVAAVEWVYISLIQSNGRLIEKRMRDCHESNHRFRFVPFRLIFLHFGVCLFAVSQYVIDTDTHTHMHSLNKSLNRLTQSKALPSIFHQCSLVVFHWLLLHFNKMFREIGFNWNEFFVI